MLTVRITYRNTPGTRALLDGRVQSDRVSLQFVLVEPISGAFRRAIRDEEFDVTEMALVTLAMARDQGKAWSGLPLVMMRGFHHGALRTRIDSDVHSPIDLPGKRIGVRAYSQTTGIWVRGILNSEYGIAPDQMKWVTTEDAHVSGFVDPPFVERAPEGTKLENLFHSNELDAVIGDSSSKFGETRSVIPDPEQAAKAWFVKMSVEPVNHVMAIRRELAEEHPWLAGEIQRLFIEAKLRSDQAELPVAVKRDEEKSIDLGLRFAFQQGLIIKPIQYGDLFL